MSDRPLVYKHLIPGVGHIKLQKLTGQHLQSFYAKKLKEGTSFNRVRQIHGLLRQALKHAKRIKLVGVNVSEGLDLPKEEKYKPYVLTPEQARSLLQVARARDLEALIALAVMTAMRKGEILGLRWSDVDLDTGIVQVSRTLNYLPVYHFVEGKPKTETSERTIVLPHVVVDLLKKHRTWQLQQKLKVGAKWEDRNLIFPNRVGNFLVPHTTLWRQFRRLLADAGLPPMHFHDLRHSAATILLNMGVPAHVVQELLGHSDVAITLGIYGHVMPSMRKDAIEKLDGLYGQQS